jgi:sugar lactone lactonase YvrE
MRSALLSAVFFIAAATVAKSQNHQLVKKWETDSIFKVPESVLLDKAAGVLYITNIDGKDPWGADGTGSIGKMGTDGKNIVVDWVKGLQAPKGMGLYKGKLYVADLKEVVVINIATGAIETRIAVDGAQGLNDISISNEGIIYVSDSKGKRLYCIKKGVPEILLDSLKGPNGVLANGKDIYVLDAGGLYKINADKTLTAIATGMEGGTDGVEVVNDKDFIVSTWAGVVYYVSADGNKQTLMDGRAAKINSADIGLDAKNKILYVPTFWRNSVVAYEVK